jgi:enoyl-[acyl-carrier protein] reductase I
MPGLLEGKTALIMGARNKWSFAWAIAEHYAEQGARLALTYQGDREEKAVKELAESVGGALTAQCDVTDSQQLESVFDLIKKEFGSLDVLVHAIAFAKKEELGGNFNETSKDGFILAQEVSAFSLVEASKYAARIMNEGGSIQTLTYLGAQRVVPHYNVMGVAKASLEASVRYLAADLGRQGIRVNALSPGPVKTLAARAIDQFDEVLRIVESRAPLGRNITTEEVADVSVFFASDLSRAISGEVVFVDNGFHATGM